MSCKMKAIIKPPRDEYLGNLLWNVDQLQEHQAEIGVSLQKLRKLGYWASLFPEGDGITFKVEQNKKKDIEMLSDFRSCFGWLDIKVDLTFSKEKAKKQVQHPRISDEEDIEISKLEVAKIQLEDAIELFLAGKRISVITLAGAADGIFSGLLKERGESSAAEDTWAKIEEVRVKTGLTYAGTRTKRDAFNEWNEHRNHLKHHDKRDDEILVFSAFDEAYYSIQRANVDAGKLSVIANNRQAYENWVIQNICMSNVT